MTKTLYLRIYRSFVPNEDCSCTGTQALKLIEIFEKLLPGCIWYAADIDTNNFVNKTKEFNKPVARKVGTTQDFKDTFSRVSQFFSGIFLLVPPTILSPKWGRELLYTEDPLTSDLGDSLVEIRAFDTSYFEIYTLREDIVRVLKEDLKKSVEIITI